MDEVGLKQLDMLEEIILQSYAKNRVMEPFEGQTGLETLQKTNLKLTTIVNNLKEFGKSRTSKVNKDFFLRFSKGNAVSPLRIKLSRLSLQFSRVTKMKLKEIEVIFKDLIFDFLKRGLELSKNEDYERWIVENASMILKREVNSLQDIRTLSVLERKTLIESCYPYRSKRYRRLLVSFDKTFSIVLGAIVATNIPGTGPIISLVSMAKTIIRMSNRINSLSIIYGVKVENLACLFEVCAHILNSIDDWDKNKEHVPLHPSVISELYKPSDKEYEAELSEFVGAVGIKEMYIAIPGIGMLSLGKINLDNLKMDLLIENLIQDYFFLNQLDQSDKKELLQKAIDDYILIYKVFKKLDYLSAIRKKQESDPKRNRRRRIGNFFRSLTASEVEFGFLSSVFNLHARAIFNTIHDLPDEEKEKRLNTEIKYLLKRC